MANEISHNSRTGVTLYAIRFQENGNVFLTNGASDEDWGTGGRDADNYDVTMTEDVPGGHFVGNFDTSGNIVAGVYPVAVYLQVGGTPDDDDNVVAQGVMNWDGTNEINDSTLTLQLNGLTSSAFKRTNEYGPGE